MWLELLCCLGIDNPLVEAIRGTTVAMTIMLNEVVFDGDTFHQCLPSNGLDKLLPSG